MPIALYAICDKLAPVISQLLTSLAICGSRHAIKKNFKIQILEGRTLIFGDT